MTESIYTPRDRSIDSEFRPTSLKDKIKLGLDDVIADNGRYVSGEEFKTLGRQRLAENGALITDRPAIVSQATWDDSDTDWAKELSAMAEPRLIDPSTLDPDAVDTSAEDAERQTQEEATDRRLATIRRVSALRAIPEADNIECAVVDGWELVVKKREFTVGDLAVYFEIDSIVPDLPVFEFLGDKRRLKTKKLRGQISQGLLLPLMSFELLTQEEYDCDPDGADYACWNPVTEGQDITQALGVLKYSPELPANLRGQAKGNFPGWITKTDEERVQNLTRSLESWQGLPVTVTEKLDGSSFTAYMTQDYKGKNPTMYTPEYEFGVCSRNVDLKETEGNAFWELARKLDLESKMLDVLNSSYCNRVVIQGEMVGPGIQKNRYGLKEIDLYVYNFILYDDGERIDNNQQQIESACIDLGLKPVPRISNIDSFVDTSLWLVNAEGKSTLNPNVEREGIVVRHYHAGKKVFSFKAISNKYLLKHED